MVDFFVLDDGIVGYRFGATSSGCVVGPRMHYGEDASKRPSTHQVNEKLWNKPATRREFADGPSGGAGSQHDVWDR